MSSEVTTAIGSLITGVQAPAIDTFAKVLIAVVPVSLAMWGLHLGWGKIRNAIGMR
jgi:hypothetical protein